MTTTETLQRKTDEVSRMLDHADQQVRQERTFSVQSPGGQSGQQPQQWIAAFVKDLASIRERADAMLSRFEQWSQSGGSQQSFGYGGDYSQALSTIVDSQREIVKLVRELASQVPSSGSSRTS